MGVYKIAHNGDIIKRPPPLRGQRPSGPEPVRPIAAFGDAKGQTRSLLDGVLGAPLT